VAVHTGNGIWSVKRMLFIVVNTDRSRLRCFVGVVCQLSKHHINS